MKAVACAFVAFVLLSAPISTPPAGAASGTGVDTTFVLPERHVPNYRVVNPSLVRGGQPTEEGFKLLRQAGVQTIVDLRNEDVLIERERRLARKLGLNFVSIPLDLFNEPSQKDIERFLQVVDDPESGPVFVHCRQGRDRTGTMVAVYRIAREKWAPRRAYDEAVAAGFRPGFVHLTKAMYHTAARDGTVASQPSGAEVLKDLKSRLSRLRGK